MPQVFHQDNHIQRTQRAWYEHRIVERKNYTPIQGLRQLLVTHTGRNPHMTLWKRESHDSPIWKPENKPMLLIIS